MQTTGIVETMDAMEKQGMKLKLNPIAEYQNLPTPASIFENIYRKNYNDVLTSNDPTIGEVAQRSIDNMISVALYLFAALCSFLDFVGRNNTMNDKQVSDTTFLILSEYPNLKFDDIALFIRQCKLAHFGKLYDLNGMVLLDWLKQYQYERNNAYNQLLQQQEQQRREQQRLQWEKENNATPQQREQYKKLVEEYCIRIAKSFSNGNINRHLHETN